MGKTQTNKGKGTRRQQNEAPDFINPRGPAKQKTKAELLGAIEGDTTAVVRLVGKRISIFGLLKEPASELFTPLPGFLKSTYSAGPTAKAVLQFDTTENAKQACDMLVVNSPVELDDYLPLDNTEWRTPDMKKLSQMAVEADE